MAQFKAIKYTDLVVKGRTDKNTGERTEWLEEEEVVLGLKDWQKAELPTARFWLMVKLRDPNRFEKRWFQYLRELKEFLGTQFVGEDSQTAIRRTIEKIERSAWNTMPSAFLAQLNIPRNIRR